MGQKQVELWVRSFSESFCVCRCFLYPFRKTAVTLTSGWTGKLKPSLCAEVTGRLGASLEALW